MEEEEWWLVVEERLKYSWMTQARVHAFVRRCALGRRGHGHGRLKRRKRRKRRKRKERRLAAQRALLHAAVTRPAGAAGLRWSSHTALLVIGLQLSLDRHTGFVEPGVVRVQPP